MWDKSTVYSPHFELMSSTWPKIKGRIRCCSKLEAYEDRLPRRDFLKYLAFPATFVRLSQLFLCVRVRACIAHFLFQELAKMWEKLASDLTNSNPLFWSKWSFFIQSADFIEHCCKRTSISCLCEYILLVLSIIWLWFWAALMPSQELMASCRTFCGDAYAADLIQRRQRSEFLCTSLIRCWVIFSFLRLISTELNFFVFVPCS